MSRNSVSRLVEHFEAVQSIIYKVAPYNPSEVNDKIKFGDCRHKTELLMRKLKKEGFEVKKIKVLFDWKDLPIPHNALKVLKSTLWKHDALAVKRNGKWIKVDCTWDPRLEGLGFPVTKAWDGDSDTLQVTSGRLKFYEVDKCSKLEVNKEEAWEFASRLNKWIAEERKNTALKGSSVYTL